MIRLVICVVLAFVQLGSSAVRFAPYYDTALEGRTNLSDIAEVTGLVDYHLAFALGGPESEGCKPKWNGQYEIDDPVVLDQVNAIHAKGGVPIVSLGGPVAPYLEHVCSTAEDLATAYKLLLDTVGTNDLNIVVESPITLSRMNTALALVQKERPAVTVSFTLRIQSEEYGITPTLGLLVLKDAVARGVRVDIVNAMVKDFECTTADFGDCIVNTAGAVLGQLADIFPDKSDQELKSMLGLSPSIGINFNGKTFQLADAQKVVDWAKLNEIAQLAFWTIERDNGGCPGMVSAYCSGVTQERFDFTRIFQTFGKK